MYLPQFTNLRPFVATALLVSMLAACGGGGSGDAGSGVSSASSGNGSSGSASTTSSSNFVPSIFLESGGSGYISFLASENSSAQYSGIASEQLSLTSASSTVFNEQTSAVIGQYIATLTQMTLVTGSGDFSTLGLGNDMQLTGQSANGFTFGLGGSPGVLQATLISTDISGQPIGSVANDVIGGVGHTLTGDTSAMPAGSIRYSMEVTTTTPMLVVNRGSSAGSSTLAQLQQDFGGTIATLGDVSYLSGMSASAPASAYAEISGVLYPATYVATGQPVPEFLLNGIELAYNQTAATFIVQELKTHASVLGVGTV